MHKKLLVAAILAGTASAGAFAQATASGAVASHPPIAVAVVAAPQTASAPKGGPAFDERTVTRDEFLKKAAEHFDEMDTNHDGKLTRDERHAFFKAHRAEWRERAKHDGPPSQDGVPPPPGGPMPHDAPHPTAKAPK
jgi:hypothetical protein